MRRRVGERMTTKESEHWAERVQRSRGGLELGKQRPKGSKRVWLEPRTMGTVFQEEAGAGPHSTLRATRRSFVFLLQAMGSRGRVLMNGAW